MSAALPEERSCHRIGDPAGTYPIYDATGSTLFPGRWNKAHSPMIYTSEHYSTAMLEKLVHGNGRLPPNQHFVEIRLPAGISYEVFSQPHHPRWDAEDCAVAKAFGHAWQRARRTALLFVPSVVARMESNVLVNPEHPEAARIHVGLHTPVGVSLQRKLGSVSSPERARPRSPAPRR